MGRSCSATPQLRAASSGCCIVLVCEKPRASGTVSGLGTQTWHWDPSGDSRTQKVGYPGRWGNSSSARLRGLIRVHLGETSWRLLKMFYRVKPCWSGWEKNQCHLGHCDCVIPLALIGRYLGSHGRCCLSTSPNYAAAINTNFDDKRPRI